MKRFAICVLALVFAVGASTAFACDKAKSASACGQSASLAAAKAGCTKGAADTASAKEGCAKDCAKTCNKADYCVDASLARAMAMLPHMTYKVGDMTTDCCKTATAKAEESNEPIVYLVGDKSFTCKQSAMKALAGEMESHFATLAKVSPIVDGQPMHCSKMAAEAAATKNTQVKYCVAGVNFDCPKEAEAVAAKLASKMEDFRASCSKSGCAKAQTASNEAGCSKAAQAGCAKTAGAKEKSGCSKGAETAAAKSGCSKGAETASAKSGCPKSCSKSKEEAQTASAEESTDESPELVQAKAVVRQMVEFVSAQRAS